MVWSSGRTRASGFSGIQVPRTLGYKVAPAIGCHQPRVNSLHKIQNFLALTGTSVHLDFWKHLEVNALGHIARLGRQWLKFGWMLFQCGHLFVNSLKWSPKPGEPDYKRLVKTTELSPVAQLW